MIERKENCPLHDRNTFGMKVKCRLLLELDSPQDLLSLDMESLPQPVFVMGGGSNLLFLGDFPGTVIHPSFKSLTLQESPSGYPEGTVLVKVGAGIVFDDFCEWAADKGLWGAENLSLIPGEAGASAVQNIGAYGVEAKDIIETVHVFDKNTRTFSDIPCGECAYGYRTSNFKTVWKGSFIVTAVTFRLSRVPAPKLDYGGVRSALAERYPSDAELTPSMIRETVISIRRKKLPDPSETGSAGSFFCNPVISREHFLSILEKERAEKGADYMVPHYDVGEMVKVPAAWMIEQCGFKGVSHGGAQVYPKQPLVIVNSTGDALPSEIVELERRVISAVNERYGIVLHPEVEHVGAIPSETK
ncbi:MAG: UDP-N-acetylmuramate dehydrogenase [Bacteroidales bacterium]|nr:UDP-N-acetylmuramate dehydrogenase [Bacteroidales bacterium]